MLSVPLRAKSFSIATTALIHFDLQAADVDQKSVVSLPMPP
ncbi:MAG: hypothetical protein ABI835_20070 [Chloroflexota bacterium]